MANEQPISEVKNQSCRRLFFSTAAPKPMDSLGKELIAMDNEKCSIATDMKSVSSIHSNISNQVLPVIGMEFNSEEDAYEFYNKYAKEVGFSIRKSRFHKDKEGKLLDRTFCCSAQGTRGADKRDGTVKCHRAKTRFSCKAMFQISGRSGDKLRVTKFIAEHSHYLASPRKSVFLRSQRTIEIGQAAELEALDQSGIAPKLGVEYMARKVGGVSNLSFLQEDYKNYLRSKRTEEMKVGDTGGVLEYLQKMQFEDPNFFYALQVDVEDLITNILWVDSRMKLDYECFGDVVCFDTTYRKHKDGRPLAMFVGVNHHKQSIIFCAALLYDETAATFMWLFDSFVNAMSGKKPKTILTDKDAAMAKALTLQWPETRHRLCVWHMYQNAAKHLSSVFEKFSTFAKDFSSCVYDHDEEEEFLNAWHLMLEKYGLQDNIWLQKRFELREKWASVYGRQIFCADMSTTQRSESMNNQIKQYIGYNYDLRRFFAHFQRLLEGIRFKELKADFKSLTSKPYLPFYVEILKGAADVYTPELFKLFSQELWRTWNCEIYLLGEEDGLTRYKIIPQKKSFHHIVELNGSDSTVTCSCKKFEFVGILCAHALKVLSFHNIKRLPDKYIMKRWTKDAKKDMNQLFAPHKTNDLKIDIATRYKVLLKSYAHLAARAALSEETFDLAIGNKEMTLNEVEIRLEKARVEEDTNGNLCLIEGTGQDEPSAPLNDQCSVKGIKCKEKKNKRGSSKRKKSALEKATGKKKHQIAEVNANEINILPYQISNQEDIEVVQPTQVLQAQDLSSQDPRH